MFLGLFILFIFISIYTERFSSEPNMEITYGSKLTFSTGLMIMTFIPLFFYTLSAIFGLNKSSLFYSAFTYVKSVFGPKRNKAFYCTFSMLLFCLFCTENVEYSNNHPNMFMGFLGFSNRIVGLIVLVGLTFFYALMMFNYGHFEIEKL